MPYLVSDKQIPIHASSKTVTGLLDNKRYNSLNLIPTLPDKTLSVGKLFITPYPAGHVKFDLPLIGSTAVRIIKSFATKVKPLTGVVKDLIKYPEGQTFAWEVKSEKGSVLIFGSMGFDDEIIYPSPDLLILPLQGHSRIFDLALEAVSRIKPSSVMLDHFDDSFPPVSNTIDADAFAKLLKEKTPDVKTFVPRHRDAIKVF